MTDPMDKAKRDAEAQAADDRLTKLIESLGGAASAQAVFGTPVEKDGVTVVPVARVRYGVGGGGGRGPGRGKGKGDDTGEGDQTGYGHGGGVQAGPVGFIELHDGRAAYTRIADPARPMAVALLIPLVAALSFVAVVVALGRRR
jgi:uncharacterized spore protein YtfJ